AGDRDPPHHALRAHPPLRPAGLRTRARRWPDRPHRRARAGRRARAQGLRLRTRGAVQGARGGRGRGRREGPAGRGRQVVAVTAAREAGTPLDVERIRADFPILSRTAHGKPLVYLDNAATSQKPKAVIDAMSSVYEEHNANIHRGVYEFSELTTALFEGAREKVAKLINAPQTREVIFCRNATEGLNLVMQTWGREHIGAGDVIVTTVLEHHSNFVPWQQLAKQAGAELVVVDIDDDGRLRRDRYAAAMGKKPKIVAITHTSNGLGVVTPAKELIAEAHAAGALVVLDGAQSVPHSKVDVRGLDCDFLAFSGHKMLAPPGSGVVWGRASLLEGMSPFMYGGDMISRVAV